MIVYRLCKSVYSNDLTGKGAEKVGGRWNSRGIPMLYTSDSRALCTAEIAVHTPLGILPFDYKIVCIQIPLSASITELKKNDLPKHWNEFPHIQGTQDIGDSFIKEHLSLCLKVPSATVQGDFNYLINPQHKDIAKIKIVSIEDFNFDKRLFKG
jgi:RES domain-containing protein